MQGFMNPCQVASCVVVRLQCISVLDPIHPGFIEGLMEEWVCVCVDGGMNGGLRAMCMDGGMDGWMRSCWVSLTALSACRNTRSRFSRRTAVITE